MFQKGRSILEYTDPKTTVRVRAVSRTMRKLVIAANQRRSMKVSLTGQVSIYPAESILKEGKTGLSNNLMVESLFHESDFKRFFTKEKKGFFGFFKAEKQLLQSRIEQVYYVCITSFNIQLFDPFSLQKVIRLEMIDLSEPEIVGILDKIASVETIKVVKSKLSSNIFSKYGFLKKVEFEGCELKNDIQLPPTRTLRLTDCNVWKINCPKLVELECFEKRIKFELVENFPRLKKLNCCFYRNVECYILPVSLRNLNIGDTPLKSDQTPLQLIKRCPLLIHLSAPKLRFEASILLATKIKAINLSISGDFPEDVDKRLKRVYVSNENYYPLNNVRLLEECREYVISSRNFNFGNLPSGPKKIALITFSMESLDLSRFTG